MKEVNNLDENQEKKKEEKLTKLKSIGIIVIALLIALGGYKIIKSSNENRLTITTKNSLQKIIEINKLSTIEYTYNGIVTKYKDNKVQKGNEEYYVAYEGKITAGIDFNEIKIDVDYSNKKVIITLPEVTIDSPIIEMGTLDFIHIEDSKEENSISQEAYKMCKKDLKEKASKETELIKNAKENAESVITALIKPWVESIDKDFKIEYKE